MKLKAGCFPIVFFIFFFFVMSCIAQAENRALEQLLEIFEKRALISPEEVEMIRETIAEDQERLLKKEKEIADKKRALIRWEKELKEKEETLQIRERAVLEAGGAPSAGFLGAEKNRAGQNAASLRVSSPEETPPQTGIPLKANYQDGFCLSSLKEDEFSLCLGGLLQTDYRYYEYENENPEKNKFDLRRVRLKVKGNVSRRFGYKFEYEFQGAGSRHLLDAYVDARVFPFATFRIGQFKEPFSLEYSTLDKNGFFAERSMGYYLTPRRDVGLMAHASLWNDRINYGLGIFNGDGMDDSTGGDVDDPELTGRLVFAPFKNRNISLWDSLQVGGSFDYARIDRNNVKIKAKTTGMTTFFDVASSAKFNIIREVDDRTRYGAEFAWTYGPLALAGEYFHVQFRDITTSADQFDTEFEDYYISLLWMLTGEKPILRNGIFQTIRPAKSVWQGGWGGLGLAFRYDSFQADDDVYDNLIYEGNSVREAEAYSIALKWYLNSSTLLAFDATRTKFDRPLLIGRDAIRGTAIYSDREDVFTVRFQLGF